MNIEEIREHCLRKPCVTESFPFDDNSLVFKVCDKVFALIALEKGVINIKCKPERAIELREQYQAVTEPWHMHKKSWNSVAVNSDVPRELLFEWVDNSYDLVVDGLPKIKQRQTKTFM